MSVLLSIDNLNAHHGQLPAVRNVSLQVHQGDILALVGANGAGKTTLLRTIAGFHAPDAGTLSLRGKDARALPPEKRGLGFVFQDLALFPHLTVADNVAFGLHGLARDLRRGRVLETLSLIGLDGLADRLGIGGFVQTIGFLLVRTEKGKQPVYADLLVDLDAFPYPVRGEFELLGEISLDQKQRHGSLPNPVAHARTMLQSI